jgi:hypothetical protein
LTLKGELRPQQPGRVIGTPGSGTGAHSEDVVWIVDSGADFTAVRDCVGRQFGYRPVEGLFAQAANGESAGLVVNGLKAEFSVEDHTGKLRTVQTSGYMVIAPDDSEEELLGMEQLADVGATLVWDPRAGTGSLRIGLAAGLAAVARSLLRRLTGN